MTTTQTTTIESEVRGYCRAFPTTFTKAKGALMFNKEGEQFIDFFAGAGALNYGHNNPRIKKSILSHIENNGLVHSMDMDNEVKNKFLTTFNNIILKPRNLDYKVQFCGPTGTNAVEAAIRLARKVTGRSLVMGFTNGYHGMTQGALSLTANSYYRECEAILQQNAGFLPYDGYLGEDVNTLDYIDKLLTDPSSGLDKPAAVILETIQGEGGINISSTEWLRGLRKLTKKHGILMIVDDIQVGCGRSGSFFSFEEAGIEPDMVLLSKSLGGYGLPLAVVLMKPELDQWKPGEYNGTFRANSLSLIGATEALSFWEDEKLAIEIASKSRRIRVALEKLAVHHSDHVKNVRGEGLVFGIEFHNPKIAEKIQKHAFKNKLIIETAGGSGQVIKLLPALTIEANVLQDGLNILKNCFEQVIKAETPSDLASGKFSPRFTGVSS